MTSLAEPEHKVFKRSSHSQVVARVSYQKQLRARMQDCAESLHLIQPMPTHTGTLSSDPLSCIQSLRRGEEALFSPTSINSPPGLSPGRTTAASVTTPKSVESRVKSAITNEKYTEALKQRKPSEDKQFSVLTLKPLPLPFDPHSTKHRQSVAKAASSLAPIFHVDPALPVPAFLTIPSENRRKEVETQKQARTAKRLKTGTSTKGATVDVAQLASPTKPSKKVKGAPRVASLAPANVTTKYVNLLAMKLKPFRFANKNATSPTK
jgi:hypothetical protein